MKIFSNWIPKGTPWPCSVFNQETLQISKSGLPPLRTYAKRNRKKDAQNYINQVPEEYNLRAFWEHLLPLQVTGNLNFQLIVPFLVLGNLLGKPQWTQNLLIRCKCRVNWVIRPIYFTSMIMPVFWSPATHHTSLA